jgi:hypothetical protein
MQEHCFRDAGALLLRCRSIALEIQEHCFRDAGALLLRYRSIALEMQEHCSRGIGALLYIAGLPFCKPLATIMSG